jgi:hypothetical protein
VLLRELLLSGAEASTEKTRHVLKQAGIETQRKNPEPPNAQANGCAKERSPWRGTRRSKRIHRVIRTWTSSSQSWFIRDWQDCVIYRQNVFRRYQLGNSIRSGCFLSHW